MNLAALYHGVLDALAAFFSAKHAAAREAVRIHDVGDNGEEPNDQGVPQPSPPQLERVPAASESVGWFGGWYRGYRASPIHESRLGGACHPRAVVWHYTAMHPDTEDALLRAWAKPPRVVGGKPRVAGAHFLIRRDGEIVQLAPIDRNASHAGGPTPGKLQFGSASPVHPNSCCIGVEISNPGRVLRTASGWVMSGTAVPIPTEWVIPDGNGKAGHVAYTEPQCRSIRELAALLGQVVPNGLGSVDIRRHNGTTVSRPRIALRHSDLDPGRKADPGPLFQDSWVTGGGA